MTYRLYVVASEGRWRWRVFGPLGPAMEGLAPNAANAWTNARLAAGALGAFERLRARSR